MGSDPGNILLPMALPYARRAGLPVAEDDRDGVLMDIEGDSDARPLSG